jgi:hypothetical protein
MAADANSCERTALAAPLVIPQILGPGVNGLAVLARNLVGGSMLDPDGMAAYTCVRRKDGNTNTPNVYDLHKVGHVRPIPAAILSASLDAGIYHDD